MLHCIAIKLALLNTIDQNWHNNHIYLRREKENIMLFKRLRYTSCEYFYRHSPDEIWPLIADPLIRQSFEAETCYRIDDVSKVKGCVGDTWTEIHIGEDCAGDIVHCIATIFEAPMIYQFASRGHHGIKQTVSYTLTPEENGCTLKEEIVFTPVWSNKIGTMLFCWALLATGLFIKLAHDPDKDAIWFQNIQNKLNSAEKPKS